MWTKLNLNIPQIREAAKILNELSLSAKGPSKQAVDTVADFLTQVKEYLIKNLDQRYGNQL
jgi:hypothetical protein